MPQNNPSTLCAFDRIRVMAMQRWCTTLAQTSDTNPDIVELERACAAADQKYKEIKSRTMFVISPSLEDMSEAIDAWATWQALVLQVSRLENFPIVGASGIRDFARELEQTIEHLTSERTYDMFLL